MVKPVSRIDLIALKARQEPNLKFTSLVHHVNEENLALCYRELKRNKACGIDGVSVEAYGENLEERLKDLVERMKQGRYQPQPVRRVEIPKSGKSETRPLGIPAVEDKLVQLVVKKILESIYEPVFMDFSYGFRPGRSCHHAINELDKEVMQKPVHYIVEVDIRKFFDNVDHEWLMRCMEERISDPNFLELIRRFLKSGYVEEGVKYDSGKGTPQGGVISPVLANIYLHYVLDLWFEKRFKKNCRGNVRLIRYCDDFVICFENKKEAEHCMEALKERLGQFGLEVSPEKTQMIAFGRRAWAQAKRYKRKVATFTFLGFIHYCATSRRGHFIMGHKTSKENLKKGLQEIKIWLKKIRCMKPMKEWWPVLVAKLRGHYAYFGLSGNYRGIKQFYNQVISLVYKWQNRRSQKRSMNWKQFLEYLNWYPLPKPRIYVDMYTLSPKRGMCH